MGGGMLGRGEQVENRRQTELSAYAILDTSAEAEFDDIVKVASEVCGMPVSLISLLDGDRQWFKAETGFGRSETPRSQSICAYAVQQDDVFEIEDLTRDARTSANPLVTGGPQVRFYAGAPLRTPEGLALGALCVLDTKPNKLTPSQAFVLRTLAHQVVTILELRRSLRLRKEGDRRNKAILESAIDYAIVSLDLKGMVTSWSPGAERIRGWDEAEMCGRPAHVFFTQEDVAAGIPEQEMSLALLHGRGTDERWHLRKDGSLFWANGEMMPLRDEEGRHEGFLKILRDRTDQRNAAAKGAADAAFMRSVLMSSADCIKVLDPDARLTYINEGGLAVMEADAFNQVNGCDWTGFWHGQAKVDARSAFWEALSGGTGHFQAPAETLKGTPKWWDVQVTPIRGTDGQPERLLVVSRDITRQRTSEQQIAESEKRWRGLFDGMQEGFFVGELVRDADGRAVDYRFIEINPAFARQSGLPADSIGQTIRSFVPDIEQWLIDSYAHVVDTGEPTLFEIGVPGLHRWFEVRANKETGQRFSCLFLDVTERKQGEVRRAAMVELGDRMRNSNDSVEILRVASDILGRTLGLSHAGYGAVDHDHETILIKQGWTAPGLPSIGGTHGFRDYGTYIDALKAGHAVIIDDVGDDPRTASDAGALAAIHVRSLLNLPVMEHGRVRSAALCPEGCPVRLETRGDQLRQQHRRPDTRRTRADRGGGTAEDAQPRTQPPHEEHAGDGPVHRHADHAHGNRPRRGQGSPGRPAHRPGQVPRPASGRGGRLCAHRDPDQRRPRNPPGQLRTLRSGRSELLGRIQGGDVAVADAARARHQRGQIRRPVHGAGQSVDRLVTPRRGRRATLRPAVVRARRPRRRPSDANRLRVQADRAWPRRKLRRRGGSFLPTLGRRVRDRRTAS